MRAILCFILFTASLTGSLLHAQDMTPGQKAVSQYADHVYRTYSESLEKAEALQSAVAAFVRSPTTEAFEEARHAWIEARVPYLRTEVFRFYSGPIDDEDGPEGLLNAWPLDELYIDGIIENATDYPAMSPAVLLDLNELEGEANISTGYHAIEYLLWGADTFADSAGQRSVTDFTNEPSAPRRREYLLTTCDLLVQHLQIITEEWAPDRTTNYRAEFLAAKADESFKKILTGMSMLTGFEMASERLLVAYDTKAQEDEHSCFSDTTHQDILYNVVGIAEVWLLIQPVAEKANPELTAKLAAQIAESVKLAAAIPAPFDQAILGEDDAPGRKSILALIEGLEDQADLLVELSKALGFEVPISE